MSYNYGNFPTIPTISPDKVFTVNTSSTLSSSVFGRNVLLNGTGSYTVALPLLSTGQASSKIWFFNDSSTGVPTLAAQGSDTIRVVGVGQATLVLNPGDSVILEHNGAAYSLVSVDPLKANLASPAFTGTPTAPTAAQNTNTTQIATTAFVLGQASGATPNALGTASPGSASTYSRSDHTHPAAASTQGAGDNSTNIATTAYVDRKMFATPVIATPTLNAGAMTVTASACTLPFRSTTLTAGGYTEILCTGLTITVPSGATLGAPAATTQRLALGVANNGGTPVMMIGNVNGLNTDTSTTVSPTTISSGATSAGVWYSNSAVAANSPFHIIGFLDSTQATAGTYATSPNVIFADTSHIGAMMSIGWGQTWQNVAGSRSFGTTYYNTTGKPILIVVNGNLQGTSQSSVTLTVNGLNVAYLSDNTAGANSGVGTPMSVIVPIGGSYTTSGSGTITSWFELR